MLGDTRLIEVQRKFAHRPVNEKLRYAMTKGLEGTAPHQTDVVYPQGGPAVFGNSWDFDQQIHAFFTAAFQCGTDICSY